MLNTSQVPWNYADRPLQEFQRISADRENVIMIDTLDEIKMKVIS